MTCPKCGSTDVTAQVLNEVELKNAHHGCLWWLLVGWWWMIVKWLFLTLPAILAKLFIPKKQKAVNHQSTVYVCQNCGHRWE